MESESQYMSEIKSKKNNINNNSNTDKRETNPCIDPDKYLKELKNLSKEPNKNDDSICSINSNKLLIPSKNSITRDIS